MIFDPSKFIEYPGGNAYFLHESIGDRLDELGVTHDPDLLEDLFWPWLRHDIKMAVEVFHNRAASSSSPKKMTPDEQETIRLSIPAFDKRRLHYLKFDAMDQGPVAAMPEKLFRHLLNKSRDEIEQHFLTEEQAMEPNEIKSYLYTAFDLQQHFFNAFIRTSYKKKNNFFTDDR